MKVKSTLLLLAGAAFLFTSESCKRADACIEGPGEINLGEPATFSSCGGGKTFSWEVYDGTTQTTYEGESITITPETPTQYGQVRLIIEGGFLGGDDETSQTYKVKNTGYPLFIRDYEFDQGNTNIEGISNAEVKVFSSFQCFEDNDESSSCLLASGTSDAEGIYKIPADVAAGTYVIDATGLDVHANWDDNVRSMEVSINDEQLYWEDQSTWVTLKPHALRYLKTKGKWNITDVLINGASAWNIVNDCVKDNYMTFERDKTFVYHEGDNECETSAESSGTVSDLGFISNYPSASTFSFKVTTNSGSLGAYSGNLNAQGQLRIYTTDGTNSATYYFTEE